MADLLAKHVAAACKSLPSLRKKHVTPHVLRHSMAMGLLQAGVDRAVIALWLGHESVDTTQIYLEANLAMKEEILAKTNRPAESPAATGLATSCSLSSRICDRTMPGGCRSERAGTKH